MYSIRTLATEDELSLCPATEARKVVTGDLSVVRRSNGFFDLVDGDSNLILKHLQLPNKVRREIDQYEVSSVDVIRYADDPHCGVQVHLRRKVVS